MSEPEKGTLYIDVDGVILPYDDEQSSQNLEKRWVNRIEFYYPEVVNALANIAAMKVLSSSRGVSFLIDTNYSDITSTIDFAGSLTIDAFRPTHIPYKLRAVANHWQHHAPVSWSTGRRHDTTAIGPRAAWIDDHALTAAYPEITKHPLLDDPHFMVVRPLGSVGLTLDHVQQINEFLNEAP